MKLFILFLSLLTLLAFTPVPVFAVTHAYVHTSATVNVDNHVVHSHITPPKKLRYKERVVLNFQKYKARFTATFKEKLKKSLGWWIASAVFLTMGIFLVTSTNRRNKNASPQQISDNNRAGGMAVALGAVVLGFGIICLAIALVVSI